MTAALIADTHGLLPDIPAEADFVIHAGDVGPEYCGASWFTRVYAPWAVKVNRPIVLTWGNHDFIGLEPVLLTIPNTIIAVDRCVRIGTVPTWFSPWSRRGGNLAFMATDDELREKYAAIPDDVGVIVSHGPPKRCCDRTLAGDEAGSVALRYRMAELRGLRMVVTGHIHEARGERAVGEVRVINCACVDVKRRPHANGPVLVEWPER